LFYLALVSSCAWRKAGWRDFGFGPPLAQQQTFYLTNRGDASATQSQLTILIICRLVPFDTDRQDRSTGTADRRRQPPQTAFEISMADDFALLLQRQIIEILACKALPSGFRQGLRDG
jgi:hypothetical protein